MSYGIDLYYNNLSGGWLAIFRERYVVTFDGLRTKRLIIATERDARQHLKRYQSEIRKVFGKECSWRGEVVNLTTPQLNLM